MGKTRNRVFKLGCILPQSFPGRSLLLHTSTIDLSGSVLKNRVVFDRPESVTIGDGCLINDDCRFHVGMGNARIELGNNVFVGMGTSFICVSHEIGDSGKRAGLNTYQSIVIGDGVWIGANATILPGVSIGAGSIVAAGSVVTGDIEPNWLYAGVPAKAIKELF